MADAAFAVSIDEPPPVATMMSGRSAHAASTAACTERSVGSPTISVNDSQATSAVRRESSSARSRPAVATPLSAITSTERPPSAATRSPAVATVPFPKITSPGVPYPNIEGICTCCIVGNVLLRSTRPPGLEAGQDGTLAEERAGQHRDDPHRDD